MALNKERTIKKLLEALETSYLLAHACKKVGVSRRTVYRWMDEDIELAREIREAQFFGKLNVSDFVEGKLMKNIESGNERSIEYWLGHNSERYKHNIRNERHYEKKIKRLESELREARSAMDILDNINIRRFEMIDYDKLLASMAKTGEEFAFAAKAYHGIYTGATPREKEVIDQVQGVLWQAYLGKVFVQELKDKEDDRLTE